MMTLKQRAVKLYWKILLETIELYWHGVRLGRIIKKTIRCQRTMCGMKCFYAPKIKVIGKSYQPKDLLCYILILYIRINFHSLYLYNKFLTISMAKFLNYNVFSTWLPFLAHCDYLGLKMVLTPSLETLYLTIRL